MEAKVSSCLVNGNWYLSLNLPSALGNITEDFDGITTDHLLEDKVVWTYGTTGGFVLKDTYNALRHKEIIIKRKVEQASVVPLLCP